MQMNGAAERVLEESLIEIRPNTLRIILRDWLLEREGYEPYIEYHSIEPGDESADMRRKSGGTWISRAVCLAKIEDVIESAKEGD
jgi:hypothetical protein